MPSSDPSPVSRHRARLATVAAHGVAISMVGPGARRATAYRDGYDADFPV